jgi:hypothetical protein
MNWHRGLIRLWLVGASVGLLDGAAYAEPNKVVYELQERCARAAEELLLRNKNKLPEQALRADPPFPTSSQNHYNRSDNRCYAIFTSFSIIVSADKIRYTTVENLLDVLESR